MNFIVKISGQFVQGAGGLKIQKNCVHTLWMPPEEEGLQKAGRITWYVDEKSRQRIVRICSLCCLNYRDEETPLGLQRRRERGHIHLGKAELVLHQHFYLQRTVGIVEVDSSSFIIPFLMSSISTFLLSSKMERSLPCVTQVP